ncbi:MAG: hypothetical protein AB7J28_02820 [Hyphomonadaceae bacterium]
MAQEHSPGRTGAAVKRPGVLAALALAAFLAAAAAIGGLAQLAAVRAAGPVTVASGPGALADALEDAPWIETGGDGPVVWAVASAQCPGCGAFFTEELEALEEEGFRVRVIVVSPRDERSALRAAWIAQLAEIRTPEALAPLTEGRALPAPRAGDAAAREGHLEWTRASYDRIAAIVARNERRMALPALFWRRGADWRALIGGAHAHEHARRELASEV